MKTKDLIEEKGESRKSNFWGATGKTAPLLYHSKECSYVNHISTVVVGCAHHLILGYSKYLMLYLSLPYFPFRVTPLHSCL